MKFPILPFRETSKRTKIEIDEIFFRDETKYLFRGERDISVFRFFGVLYIAVRSDNESDE